MATEVHPFSVAFRVLDVYRARGLAMLQVPKVSTKLSN